jgi:hypothetical protein
MPNPETFKDPMGAWQSQNEMEVVKEDTPIETMIKEMIGTDNIEIKTDLTDQLIVALTKGTIYADRYKNDLMGKLVLVISKYRISRNRKGREEMREMAKGLGSYNMEESPSFMSRLFKGE